MNHVAPIDHVSNDIGESLDLQDCADALEAATAAFCKLSRSVHEMLSNAEAALGSHAVNDGPVAEMRLRYIDACQAMHALQEDLEAARAKLVQREEPKSGRVLRVASRVQEKV